MKKHTVEYILVSSDLSNASVNLAHVKIYNMLFLFSDHNNFRTRFRVSAVFLLNQNIIYFFLLILKKIFTYTERKIFKYLVLFFPESPK